MTEKEKIKYFHDLFIRWSFEAINRNAKLSAQLPVAKEQNALDRTISITAKVPIIGNLANLVDIISRCSQTLKNSYSKKYNIAISHLSHEEQLKILSELALYELKDCNILERGTEEISNLVGQLIQEISFSAEYPAENISTKRLDLDSLSIGVLKSSGIDSRDDNYDNQQSINDYFIAEKDSDYFEEYRLKKRIKEIEFSQHSQEPYFYNAKQIVANFVGREDSLRSMFDLFSPQDSKIIVIGGLGGVGKTQLTLKFIAQFKENYKYKVRWIKAESQDSLDNSYREFARDLNMNLNNANAEDILRFVKKKLESEIDQSLLVFDNSENRDLLYKYLPNLTALKKHHIIITTRNTESYDQVKEETGESVIKLGSFNDEEAVRYVRSYLPETQEQDALKLSNLFSNIPLGICHSLSFKKRSTMINSLSIDEYIKIYKEIIHNAGEQDNNIHSTIKMTLETLPSKAKEMLSYCSYLDHNNIPTFLFSNSFFSSIEEEISTFNTLESLSLTSVEKVDDNNYISLHTIVQDTIRTTINNFDKLEDTMHLVHKAITISDDKVIPLPVVHFFLQHISSLMKHYNNVEDKSAKLSKIAMLLWNDYGNIYFTFGQFHQAQKAYQDSLHVYRSIVGYINEFKETNILCNLGTTFLALNKPQEALLHFQSIAEKFDGLDNNKNLALIKNKIGYSYLLSGNKEEALKAYNDAREIFALNQDSLNLADNIYQTADVYRAFDYQDEALKALEESLKQYQEINHELKSKEMASIYHALGKVYLEKNEYALSEDYFNRAIRINQQLLGPNHFTVAINLRGICRALKAQEKLEEALSQYGAVLEIFNKEFNRVHALIVVTYREMAEIYKLQNNEKDTGYFLRLASDLEEKIMSSSTTIDVTQDLQISESFKQNQIASQDLHNLPKKIDYSQNSDSYLSQNSDDYAIFSQHTSSTAQFRLHIYGVTNSIIDYYENAYQKIISLFAYKDQAKVEIKAVTSIRYYNALLNSDVFVPLVTNIKGKDPKILNNLLDLSAADPEISDLIVEAVKEYGAEHVINIFSNKANTCEKISKNIELFNIELGWELKKIIFYKDISKFYKILSANSIDKSLDILKDYSEFRKSILIKLHPDKGGNDQDFIFAKELHEKLNGGLNIKAIIDEKLQSIQPIIHKATIGFKALDTVANTIRLINEPNLANAMKIAFDFSYLYGINSGVNGFSLVISGADSVHQCYKGEYEQAIKHIATTFGYMSLPTMMAFTGIPHIGFAYGAMITAYTGYYAINNAYSLYLEYGTIKWQLKSAMAYEEL